ELGTGLSGFFLAHRNTVAVRTAAVKPKSERLGIGAEVRDLLLEFASLLAGQTGGLGGFLQRAQSGAGEALARVALPEIQLVKTGIRPACFGQRNELLQDERFTLESAGRIGAT
ncbi:MAG: hypothetical protein ACK56I_29675, partial [bacterium]